jgi:hypothetical protein
MSKSARSIEWLAAAVAVTASFAISPDAAAVPEQFPYCAASRGDQENYMNCGFATFEACLEELKGMRGYCAPNPYYVAAPSPPAPSNSKPQRVRSRPPS